MRNNNFLGIIFPNVHDDFLSEMTSHRSMGSVPFCGRYRLIDFSLSNLVNAGVAKVGIVTKTNYQSLMDHIGSGKAWDLNRKNGGLFFLPPYSNNAATVYKGHVDGLFGAISFLENSTEKYVVLCDCDVVANIDLKKMLERHIQSGADITVAYKHGTMPRNHHDVMSFELDNDKITNITFASGDSSDCNYSLDITIVSRQRLISLIKKGHENNLTSLSRHILQPNFKDFDIRGYKIDEYAAVIDSFESYVRVSNEVLMCPDARRQLFSKDRPVFTKTRDDMPTVYGLKSQVENSLIADGCIVEGTVKNSILFRGVKVKPGAIIENSIVMQDSIIEDGAEIENATLDKKVIVGAGKSLRGTPTYPIYVRKKTEV